MTIGRCRRGDHFSCTARVYDREAGREVACSCECHREQRS